MKCLLHDYSQSHSRHCLNRDPPWRGPFSTALTQLVFLYVTYHLLALQRIRVCNFGHRRPCHRVIYTGTGFFSPPLLLLLPVSCQPEQPGHSFSSTLVYFILFLLVRFQVRVVCFDGLDCVARILFWELSMLTSWWFSLCYTHRILDVSTSCL